MELNEGKRIVILSVITIVVFVAIYFVLLLTEYAGKNQNPVAEDKATQSMERLYKKIQVTTLPPIKGSVDLEEADIAQSLPDISLYPTQVDNSTPNYIEICSSLEKATVSDEGFGCDRWLVDMAEAFNQSGILINNKPVSVRIRAIASGAAMDYISSGKYIPDAFSPSNELWYDALKSKNVDISLAEKRLAGNVAGIVLTRSKYEEISMNYGFVNLKTFTEAVAAGEITMGYTNPYASSAGANFLLSTLFTFDQFNPLSDTAVSAFENFQQNISFLAYSTSHMRSVAQSGILDAFVFEYRQYMNTPNLKSDYVFIPYGVRHDNPVYTLGQLSEEKQEILQQFIAFTKKEENQELATKYGFNAFDHYTCEFTEINGTLLNEAQKIWKEKKNGNREIVSVFVADVSGSMEGESLKKLKTSLLSGSKFIGTDCSVGLVTFSDRINIALPIAKFDLNQRSLFAGAVKNMNAGGGSAMFDAIIVGEKMLMDVKASHPEAKLLLFVLTDGGSNTGNTLNDIRWIIEGLRVPIYTIGYNADNNTQLDILSGINEAANVSANIDDVVYKIQDLFNAEM